MMPTAGSRLNLLAQAELRTGRNMGYRETWFATALVLNEAYRNQRFTHRRLYPFADTKGLTQV